MTIYLSLPVELRVDIEPDGSFKYVIRKNAFNGYDDDGVELPIDNNQLYDIQDDEDPSLDEYRDEDYNIQVPDHLIAMMQDAWDQLKEKVAMMNGEVVVENILT